MHSILPLFVFAASFGSVSATGAARIVARGQSYGYGSSSPSSQSSASSQDGNWQSNDWSKSYNSKSYGGDSQESTSDSSEDCSGGGDGQMSSSSTADASSQGYQGKYQKGGAWDDYYFSQPKGETVGFDGEFRYHMNGDKKEYEVWVGNADGELVYHPETLKVPSNTVVMFKFLSMNHTVTQSTFDAPCVPIAPEQGKSVLNSGFIPGSPDDSAAKYTFLVEDDSAPMWYYCAQGKHCQMGMVGVINPPADKPDRTIEAHKELAAKVEKAVIPSSPDQGGSDQGSDQSSDQSSAQSSDQADSDQADSDQIGSGSPEPSAGGDSGAASAEDSGIEEFPANMAGRARATMALVLAAAGAAVVWLV